MGSRDNKRELMRGNEAHIIPLFVIYICICFNLSIFFYSCYLKVFVVLMLSVKVSSISSLRFLSDIVIINFNNYC